MMPFDANQLRLIAPEMVLILSAFLVLILSAMSDKAKTIWAPGLAFLACLMTLVAVLGFAWSFGLGHLRQGKIQPDLWQQQLDAPAELAQLGRRRVRAAPVK